MNQKNIILVIVGLIVVGAAAFYGGVSYARAKAPAGRNFTGGQAGQFRNGQMTGMNGGQRGGFNAGQVISKDDKSVTIKLADGGSKIIFFGNSTAFLKTASTTSSDINVGDNVVATGQANSDGSITAQSIQIGSFFPNRMGM